MTPTTVEAWQRARIRALEKALSDLLDAIREVEYTESLRGDVAVRRAYKLLTTPPAR